MEKQIILVEDFSTKLYIHYPDQESQIIDTPNPLMGKSRKMERGKIIADLFTRLIRQGYELVGTNSMTNVGCIYVFQGMTQGAEMEF